MYTHLCIGYWNNYSQAAKPEQKKDKKTFFLLCSIAQHKNKKKHFILTQLLIVGCYVVDACFSLGRKAV